MKNLKWLQPAFVVSLIVFNFIFWNENLGLNLFLFTLLLIGGLYLNYKESFRSLNVKVTVIGTILSSLMVLFFNSTESKIANILSFTVLVAFVHQSSFRSIYYAFLHIVTSVVMTPFQLYKRKKEQAKKVPNLYRALRILRMSLVPFLIAFIFYQLYSYANPLFSHYASQFFGKIINGISLFFETISLGRIFFIFFGAIILSIIYYRNEVAIYLDRDLSHKDKMERIRQYRSRKSQAYSFWTGLPVADSLRPPFPALALKNQSRRGIILLIMVNVLLLAENFVDIRWLWFNFQLPAAFSLKEYVREGTGVLIFSIFLSMAVLLYYFKKNQNFYKDNKWLKQLALLWIIQNGVLAYSVFLRNYHYIDFHGLAYKRIGVLVFICLTIFGLVTMYYKIRKVKSVYFLVRLNTWAVYVTMIALTFFNWDVQIAKYNLAHWNKGEIDVDFYLALSDKAMPMVYENLDSVKAQITAHQQNEVKWINYLNFDDFKEALEQKRSRFVENYSEHSWLSYNRADKEAFDKLIALK